MVLTVRVAILNVLFGVVFFDGSLSKSFGDQKVLNGINLEVAQGETVSVLGRSGTGKSVLLKLIIGLHKPDRLDPRPRTGGCRSAAEVVERGPKNSGFLVPTGGAL